MNYGLTSTGFVPKPQQQIITEIEASLQSVFGQNINLSPESNFGQLVGILSEREALLWQLGEAVYASGTIAGAEGTSVDNILAFTNLRRLAASPTRTNPTPVVQADGTTLNGLVLYGTPGTVIPAGSVVQTSATPPLQFSLDNSVTIAAPVVAVQSLFFSNIPTQGSFSLNVNGTITPAFPYNVTAAQIQAALPGVTIAPNALGFNFTFGAAPQPLIILVSNSLQNGNTVTNINISNNANGAPAQGIGTATCVEDGLNFIAAGSINAIGTSITGLTSVANQLDCITGTELENDTEALKRRQANLQAQANGPLQAIEEKVRTVENVTTAIGFENTNEAALQLFSFGSTPTTGTYKLIMNGSVTAAIAYNATAPQIQAAVRLLPGYSTALVTGSLISGFTLDFNGSLGGQPQNLVQVFSNSTGVPINVSFGRPGKSFEIVVDGGADLDIANSIFASKPAGIQAYGSKMVTTYDANGNPYNIGFSRPTQVPIYISIALEVDSDFNPQSISTIQQDLVAIGDAFGIGGLVVGFGTNGLIGAFNNVPGIISYSLFFDRAPNPTTNTNVQMQAQEVPIFETFNIAVSYS